MSDVPTGDVFKFMSLRPPQKVQLTDLQNNFIYYDTQASAPSGETLLYVDIVSSLAGSDPWTDVLADVNTWRGTSAHYYADPAALYTAFPNFDIIGEYLAGLDESVAYSTITYQIGVDLGTSLDEYVEETLEEKNLRLWDNLFSLSVVTDNPALKAKMIDVLRILKLFVRIYNEDALIAVTGGVMKAMQAKIVMPSTVFPLPLPANVVNEYEGEVEAPIDLSPMLDEIDELEAARDELFESFDDQILAIQAAQREEDIDIVSIENTGGTPKALNAIDPDANEDAMVLKSANFTALTAATKTKLNDLKVPDDNVNLPQVAQRINRRLTRLYSQTFDKLKGEVLTMVGNSLIRVSQLCGNAYGSSAADPCAQVSGVSLPTGSGSIQPVGIGDLLVVQQQLLKYEMGEVAHIENVLKSEEKLRTHRSLDRHTQTTILDSETVRESEKDTQTTERFSLEKEVSNVIASDNQFSAGASVTADYGAVQVSGNANYATSNSQSEANSIASSYAQEVTKRALERVIERVREQRITTDLREVEIINEHTLNNAAGTGHVTGIYRWVDKYYLNKVMNYGKRLMFEFIIPEPAAFHIHAMQNNANDGLNLVKPIDPADNGLNSFQDISEDNYSDWAALYNAQDVAQPPQQFITIADGYSQESTEGFLLQSETYKSLVVPEGYEAVSGNSIVNVSNGGWVHYLIGKQYQSQSQRYTFGLNNLTGEVPVTIMSGENYILNIEVTCRRTQQAYTDWKIQTFNAIQSAYGQLLSRYENGVISAKVQSGIKVQGDNPARNREVERVELKKGCLELLTAQRFETFDAMQSQASAEGYPEFDATEAMFEGKYIQFFEQAFEWNQITYLHYPYFWGRKPNWTVVKQFKDADPEFTKFLQAGASKVLVPVRPAYQEAVLHYLSTGGEIWNGEGAPTIDDELYLSIITELLEAANATEGEELPQTWISKVPTSLVMIDPTDPPELPDNSTELLPS